MKGPIIELLPLALEHVDGLTRHSADTGLWTWWLRKPPVDAETMQIEVELALAQQKRGLRTPFAIFHRERKECIGSTSLWHVDTANRSLEIGSTWLGSAFHRTGINRECKNLLLRHAFTELKMNRVVLQTDVLNTRSRRAIEKLGAKFEGIRREDLIAWNGRIRSSAVYSILRTEWPGG